MKKKEKMVPAGVTGNLISPRWRGRELDQSTKGTIRLDLWKYKRGESKNGYEGVWEGRTTDTKGSFIQDKSGRQNQGKRRSESQVGPLTLPKKRLQ